MWKLNPAQNLGFVTVLAEGSGYLGGYLVTNTWGRPLEFRLTTSVQPNRVQQILYGPTLKPYIYADVIGRTLVEKASVPTRVLFTDCEPLLDLRLHLLTPVAWLAEPEDELARSLERAGAGVGPLENGVLLCHPKFTADAQPIRAVLDHVDQAADLTEPFARIREALQEARKMGVTARGA
jgi:hypothetical protein